MSGYDSAVMRPHFEQSVAAYREASDQTSFPGADVHQVSEARTNLVGRLVDLANTYNTWDSQNPPPSLDRETATVLFQDAYDEWAYLIVDPELEDDSRSWATRDLGEGVLRLWDLLAGTLSEGEDLDDPSIRANLGVQILIIIPDQYAFVDDGRNAAESLFQIASLHENAAHALENASASGWNTKAIAHWVAGIPAIDRLNAEYGTHFDWWPLGGIADRRAYFEAERVRVASLPTAASRARR